MHCSVTHCRLAIFSVQHWCAKKPKSVLQIIIILVIQRSQENQCCIFHKKHIPAKSQPILYINMCCAYQVVLISLLWNKVDRIYSLLQHWQFMRKRRVYCPPGHSLQYTPLNLSLGAQRPVPFSIIVSFIEYRLHTKCGIDLFYVIELIKLIAWCIASQP